MGKFPGSFRPSVDELELRITPAVGDLDTTFGRGGFLSSPSSVNLNLLKILPSNGQDPIFVGGTANNPNTDTEFYLSRVSVQGTYSIGFAGGGPLVFGFGSDGTNLDREYDFTVDQTGRAVMVGAASVESNGVPSPTEFAVARSAANGQLDPTFGTGGKVTLGFGPNTNAIARAVFPGTGLITVAGTVSSSSGQSLAFARFEDSGQLDPTYGAGGVVLEPITFVPSDIELSFP